MSQGREEAPPLGAQLEKAAGRQAVQRAVRAREEVARRGGQRDDGGAGERRACVPSCGSLSNYEALRFWFSLLQPAGALVGERVSSFCRKPRGSTLREVLGGGGVRMPLFECTCSNAIVRMPLFECTCSNAIVRMHLFECTCSNASPMSGRGRSARRRRSGGELASPALPPPLPLLLL